MLNQLLGLSTFDPNLVWNNPAFFRLQRVLYKSDHELFVWVLCSGWESWESAGGSVYVWCLSARGI